MEQCYLELFDFAENIERKQREQKARGLNDYNMVNVVRRAHAEVGMHSNVLYSLLDPEGAHYQGPLFLNLFIQHVLGIPLEKFGELISVQAEESTKDKRRIDFTIKSTKLLIGIEMKVNAKDLKNQIFDYHEELLAQSQGESEPKKVIIYYLTKYGKEPPPHSTKDVEAKVISFNKQILKWIVLCQKEVKNISNLNLSLENYKDIVRKITKNYKGNVMDLSEELIRPEMKEKLMTAIRLESHVKKAKGPLLQRFFEDITKFITSKHGKNGVQEISDIISNRSMVLNNEKCIKWFESGISRKKDFGLFFTLENNNIYRSQYCLYIMVAKEAFHFGYVGYTYNQLKNEYIINDIDENSELNNLFIKYGEYRNWNHLKWYSF